MKKIQIIVLQSIKTNVLFCFQIFSFMILKCSFEGISHRLSQNLCDSCGLTLHRSADCTGVFTL